MSNQHRQLHSHMSDFAYDAMVLSSEIEVKPFTLKQYVKLDAQQHRHKFTNYDAVEAKLSFQKYPKFSVEREAIIFQMKEKATAKVHYFAHGLMTEKFKNWL